MNPAIMRVGTGLARAGVQLFSLFTLLLALFVTAGLARADGTPVSGTAGDFGASSYSFGFSGPGLTLFSTTADAPNQLAPICDPNSICNVTVTLPTCVTLGFPIPDCPQDTNANLNGVSADVLVGSLTFSGLALMPNTADGTYFILNDIPVIFQGSVTGYDLLNCPDICALSGPLWNLTISGTGSLELIGNTYQGQDVFTQGIYTFTGTATQTPEPASMFLVGSGLTAVGLIRRRRRN
jgi:PEP-CTERM motif